MLDLKAVTHDDFAACLKQPFTVEPDAATAVEMELVEVRKRDTFDPERQTRAPFSIVFTGEPETVLPQGIYRMRHAQLGAMELFLVPVGRDGKGIQYEAVFS